jgi:hypothetical protein
MGKTKIPDPPKWIHKAGTASPDAVFHGESLRTKADRVDARIKDYSYGDVPKRRRERDIESDIADLLGDLLHLCDKEGLDFEKLSKRALNYYKAEINGE